MLTPALVLRNVFISSTEPVPNTANPPSPFSSSSSRDRSHEGTARFYAGRVHHARRSPTKHEFAYDVRMAVIDLDDPPPWFQRCRGYHEYLTSDEARLLAGFTSPSGRVEVLTHPSVAGYVQNPISVYYCYPPPAGGDYGGAGEGGLRSTSTSRSDPRGVHAGNPNSLDGGAHDERGPRPGPVSIVEVTNTPWGERVRFLVDSKGGRVSKCLHVSPLMDMRSDWTVVAPPPTDTLRLSVSCHHDDMGSFFHASFVATLDSTRAGATNEAGGLRVLWRYGFQPQRVAVWIYVHAVRLLLKGVPFYAPPWEVVLRAVGRTDTRPLPMPVGGGRKGDRKRGTGGKKDGGDVTRHLWYPAPGWPWRA